MNTNVCNEDNLSVTLATQAVSDVRAQRKEERMEKTRDLFKQFRDTNETFHAETVWSFNSGLLHILLKLFKIKYVI